MRETWRGQCRSRWINGRGVFICQREPDHEENHFGINANGEKMQWRYGEEGISAASWTQEDRNTLVQIAAEVANISRRGR